MQVLSFDIEISDIFELEPYEDMEAYAPFNISVAATAIHGGEERVWYSKGENSVPALNLTPNRAHDLLSYLDDMQQNDVMVCAWNGLGFDLKWIGHQANDIELAARVALKSFDPMFQFFNIAGFPVKLSKVAEAMGIQQEKLMDGAEAPKEWRAGNHQLVMDYCVGDCQMTNKVIEAIRSERQVQWVTAKGHVSAKSMPRLKNVSEVIKDPEPDQTWMREPIPKMKFYGWVLNALKGNS